MLFVLLFLFLLAVGWMSLMRRNRPGRNSVALRRQRLTRRAPSSAEWRRIVWAAVLPELETHGLVEGQIKEVYLLTAAELSGRNLALAQRCIDNGNLRGLRKLVRPAPLRFEAEDSDKLEIMLVTTTAAVFLALFGFSDGEHRELLGIKEVPAFDGAVFGARKLVFPV
jgi:hypothetical protein